MFDQSDFDLISLLYAFLSLDTLWRLRQQWKSFWDDNITRQDRLLAQRVALFLLIPLGVLFHEVGHALATWQVGGTVVDFQWRLFWGYVTAVGDFTPLERWWISLSGNVVSIVLGILAIPAFLMTHKPILKQILLTFTAAELVYSVVFYPIFSFMSESFEGDWVTIYNFSVYPYAQITLVLHLTLLVTLWYWLKVKKITQQIQIPISNLEIKTPSPAPEPLPEPTPEQDNPPSNGS